MISAPVRAVVKRRPHSTARTAPSIPPTATYRRRPTHACIALHRALCAHTCSSPLLLTRASRTSLVSFHRRSGPTRASPSAEGGTASPFLPRFERCCLSAPPHCARRAILQHVITSPALPSPRNALFRVAALPMAVASTRVRTSTWTRGMDLIYPCRVLRLLWAFGCYVSTYQRLPEGIDLQLHTLRRSSLSPSALPPAGARAQRSTCLPLFLLLPPAPRCTPYVRV
jgi:hypothetical protein